MKPRMVVNVLGRISHRYLLNFFHSLITINAFNLLPHFNRLLFHKRNIADISSICPYITTYHLSVLDLSFLVVNEKKKRRMTMSYGPKVPSSQQPLCTPINTCVKDNGFFLAKPHTGGGEH